MYVTQYQLQREGEAFSTCNSSHPSVSPSAKQITMVLPSKNTIITNFHAMVWVLNFLLWKAMDVSRWWRWWKQLSRLEFVWWISTYLHQQLFLSEVNILHAYYISNGFFEIYKGVCSVCSSVYVEGSKQNLWTFNDYCMIKNGNPWLIFRS